MVSNEFIKSIPGLDEYFSGLSSDFLDKMHVKIIPPNVTFVKKNIVLLHAFLKKTQKTPKKEIKKAEDNYLDVINNPKI